MGILLGFLYLLLHIAIIVFIAWAILWILGWFGVTVSAEMIKWGKVIVALLVAIAIVHFLAAVLGGGLGSYRPIWRY